jgi:hypothetical protein
VVSQQHGAKKRKRKLPSIINIVLITVGFISSLITIITLLTPFLKATFFDLLVPLQSYLIPISFFILGVCITIIGISILRIIYMRFYPVRWFLYGYRWVNAKYYYCIEDDTKVQHSQLTEITLRATRIGVSIFENKYSWSGLSHGRQESLEVLSSGHELMGSITKQQNFFPYDRWRYYYIYLGHEMPIDEDIEVKIKQVLYDDSGRFEPYVSKIITEPLESLNLTVLMPVTLSFHNAYNYELDRGPRFKRINRVACPRRHVQVNGNWYIELSYVIAEPHLDHKYQIRWEW